MSLTKAQKQAYNKLTPQAKSAAELGVDTTTLNALVTKGYAFRRAPYGTHNTSPDKIFYGKKQ